MLSLVEQLHNFLAEWEANQQWAGKAGAVVGECAFCGRARYVHYHIDVDQSFCAPRCFQRYVKILTMGRTYAG